MPNKIKHSHNNNRIKNSFKLSQYKLKEHKWRKIFSKKCTLSRWAREEKNANSFYCNLAHKGIYPLSKNHLLGSLTPISVTGDIKPYNIIEAPSDHSVELTALSHEQQIWRFHQIGNRLNDPIKPTKN